MIRGRVSTSAFGPNKDGPTAQDVAQRRHALVLRRSGRRGQIHLHAGDYLGWGHRVQIAAIEVRETYTIDEDGGLALSQRAHDDSRFGAEAYKPHTVNV